MDVNVCISVNERNKKNSLVRICNFNIDKYQCLFRKRKTFQMDGQSEIITKLDLVMHKVKWKGISYQNRKVVMQSLKPENQRLRNYL